MSHPRYVHIPLLVAEENRRLSKRDHDAGFEELLVRYKTPEAIIGHIAGICGLAPTCDPATPEQLLDTFDIENLPELFSDPVQIPWS